MLVGEVAGAVHSLYAASVSALKATTSRKRDP
jgi:hypothetical protein